MNPDDYPPRSPQPEQYQTPQQPQAAPPSSIDYLNSIAAPVDTRPVKPWLIWVLIGGVIAVVGLIGLFALTAGGPSQAEQMTSYVYRLKALEKVATDNAKSIQSSELRAISGSMNTILTGADQESQDQLSALGVKKVESIPKDAAINTEVDELNSKLDDARLNAIFDRVYAREMAYQLGKLRAQMQMIYTKTKSTSLKAYLNKTDDSIKPLIDQFNKYSNSQS